MSPDLAEKRRAALGRFEGCRSVLVALSGGVDSAVLLFLALEALGRDRVLAVTGNSASLPAAELASARRLAQSIGARHEVLETREMESADYRANRGDRCFHCRDELFSRLSRLAGERGIERVVYGAIADDLGDRRPGMRAAGLHGVGAPLLEAGLTKAEVRSLAAQAGLAAAEKPASACLASRIPVGVEVTPQRLAQVERAEEGLRDLGFVQFRVRHHGEVARVELDADGERRIADPAVRSEAVRRIRDAGYRFVALDLEGYRSGSTATGPARSGGQ
jgi:uncharacterized protein